MGLARLAGAPAVVPDRGAETPVNEQLHPKPRQYKVETILGDKQVFNGFR